MEGVLHYVGSDASALLEAIGTSGAEMDAGEDAGISDFVARLVDVVEGADDVGESVGVDPECCIRTEIAGEDGCGAAADRGPEG